MNKLEDKDSIISFKSQSSWRLSGLGIITYGVYFAHYIKLQTTKLNKLFNDEQKISNRFVNLILVMSYISLILFIAFIFADEGHPVERVSDKVDLILVIMILVWGLKAGRRLNTYYKLKKSDKEWFNDFWSAFLSPIYFNYKINKICEDIINHS